MVKFFTGSHGCWNSDWFWMCYLSGDMVLAKQASMSGQRCAHLNP
jgi:hypothetical protein